MTQEIVKPKYLLRHPAFLDGHYHDRGEVIEYDGVPNAKMEPMNPAAEERLAVWWSALPRPRIYSGNGLSVYVWGVQAPNLTSLSAPPTLAPVLAAAGDGDE
jgi:hypothetical protein